MKVLVAIDSLKGCLSSADANHAAAEGIKIACPTAEVVEFPVSDGGEGWLEAYQATVGHQEQNEIVEVPVCDPLMRIVRAKYLIVGQTAIIEIAQACGLGRIKPEERNPIIASSYGVGQLISNAISHGCRHFIIGLGGSGTSDAGRGMLEAMTNIPDGLQFTIATDVSNPLCGQQGAATVFGPQKGATPEMIIILEERARQFAQENARRMGFDCSTRPGSGAAGGLGYAFMQFFHAQSLSGADLLLKTYHFDEQLKTCELVLTGEGRADRQTLMGKLPYHILLHAQAFNVPCHLLAGDIKDRESLLAAGFAKVHDINPPTLPLSQALLPDVARRQISHASATLALEAFSRC